MQEEVDEVEEVEMVEVGAAVEKVAPRMEMEVEMDEMDEDDDPGAPGAALRQSCCPAVLRDRVRIQCKLTARRDGDYVNASGAHPLVEGRQKALDCSRRGRR